MHPMHIAYVTCELNRGEEIYPGGLAAYTFNVASGMQERGHMVTIFLSGSSERTFSFRGLTVVESAPRLPRALRPLQRYLARRIPVTLDRVMRSLSIRRSIRNWQGKAPIDIIHYSNWKATGLFRVSTPSVIRISSFDPSFDNNPDSRHLDKRLSWFTESLCIRRFNRVFGPGDHLASIIERELRLKRPIDILPTPYRLVPCNPDVDFRMPGKHLVVYAGTISRFKGAELLFSIIRRYLARFPDTAFLLAGKTGTMDGRSVEPALQKLLEEHPLNLMYRPHLRKADLMSAYAQADAVLIPSLVDNFPNVALEAMSQRALVIASETSSLGTLLRDGDNGFVIRGRDTDHWVERLRHVLTGMTPDDLERMRTRMMDVLKGFTIDRALDILEGYYRSSLQEDGGRDFA